MFKLNTWSIVLIGLMAILLSLPRVQETYQIFAILFVLVLLHHKFSVHFFYQVRQKIYPVLFWLSYLIIWNRVQIVQINHSCLKSITDLWQIINEKSPEFCWRLFFFLDIIFCNIPEKLAIFSKSFRIYIKTFFNICIFSNFWLQES